MNADAVARCIVGSLNPYLMFIKVVLPAALSSKKTLHPYLWFIRVDLPAPFSRIKTGYRCSLTPRAG